MKNIKTIVTSVITVGMLSLISTSAKAVCTIAPSLITCPPGVAVNDVVSIPNQTLVQGIQGVLSAYTDVERELQGQLKDLHFEAEFMGVKVGVSPADEALKPVEKGLVTALTGGDDKQIATAKQIAADSQTILKTVEGTMTGIDRYVKTREINEQEAAIEMLAAVLVLKKGTETVQELLREFDLGKYEKVDNYMLALEGNLAVSTMYNQMLSLEQQVTGMRLSTLSSQRMIQAQPILQKKDKN